MAEGDGEKGVVVVTFTVVKGVSGEMYETEGGGKIIPLRGPEGDRERERKWDVWRRSGRCTHTQKDREACRENEGGEMFYLDPSAIITYIARETL